MQQGPSSSKCLEVSNIKSLLEDLQHLRDKWPRILSEARLVANQIGIKVSFHQSGMLNAKNFMMSLLSYLTMKKVSRMRKLALNALFFNVILDFVIADLTTRYTAANQINNLCSLLWQYRDLPDEILQAKAEKFIQIYSTDVSDDLVTELKDLKSIHVPNFGIQPLSPIELLNRIYKSKLQSLFPN